MKTCLIKPKNNLLKKYVQYFLFFHKEDNSKITYTTFPNTNLCLAVYKQNQINYTNHSHSNSCHVNYGNALFTSKLFGFHKMPFEVQISTHFEEFCIVLHPEGLRTFTKENISNLMKSETVFNDLFSPKNNFILEQIFEEKNLYKKTEYLESLLLQHVKNDIPQSLEYALNLISSKYREHFSIETLADELKISDTSLYRLFKNNIGQNPKSYIKTLRFRSVLNELKAGKKNINDIKFINQYYDQAHFIKDFKQFTGFSPTKLIPQIAQEDELTWIFNKINIE